MYIFSKLIIFINVLLSTIEFVLYEIYYYHLYYKKNYNIL